MQRLSTCAIAVVESNVNPDPAGVTSGQTLQQNIYFYKPIQQASQMKNVANLFKIWPNYTTFALQTAAV